MNFVGHFKDDTGLGEAARSHVRALRAARVPHYLRDFSNPRIQNKVYEIRKFSDQNPYPVNLVELNFNRDIPFLEAAGQPFFEGKRNIGYWVWEFAEFPEERLVNFDLYDEIWTPARFLRDGFSRVSPIPVHAIPYSITAPRPRGDAAILKRRFNIPHETFVFLSLFSYGSNADRKNPEAVIEAFQRAFQPQEPVMLLIKSNHPHYNPEAERRIAAAVRHPRIRLWNESLSRQGLADLMGAADCYVSLHRAEGFGLPIAEAMALGKLAIATGYSGNMEFMTAENSLPVRYTPVSLPQDNRPYKKGWVWAEPDVEHAAFLMRKALREPPLARALGTRARQTILDRFSPLSVGRTIRARLQELCRRGCDA